MKKLNYLSELFAVLSAVCCGQNYKGGKYQRGEEKGMKI